MHHLFPKHSYNRHLTPSFLFRYPYGTILDWDQYYANLEEANQSGVLQYKLEYTASKLYNVDHFDASGLQGVFEAISLDETVRQQYTAFRAVNGDKAADI